MICNVVTLFEARLPTAVLFSLACITLSSGADPPQDAPAPRFIRGDADNSQNVHFEDALFLLEWLFHGTGRSSPCPDSADSDDNGRLDISDAIYLINFTFIDSLSVKTPPAAPYPGCGEDPTPDDLTCEGYEGCTPLPEFQNSVRMHFVWIEPGSFLMGSPPDERGRDSLPDPPDERLHEVHISCGFYMSATEVTQRQFEDVMGFNPARETRRPELAVNHVAWSAAVEFCRRLTVREGLQERVYRLPTEAEWEYACRAGTQTRYSFGDALECDDLSGGCEVFDTHMYYNGNVAGVWPPPVGVKRPNPWGLFDMHGSLSEWCSDWYAPYPDREVTDPSGPRTGTDRVMRGHAIILAHWGRSAARGFSRPDQDGASNFGLRIVFGGCPRPPYTR